MFNFAALENSKRLYEKATNYFAGTDLVNCVIEASDLPYAEWKVHQFTNVFDLGLFRLDLLVEKRAYVSLYTFNDEIHFFYSDLVFSKCLSLNTDKVTYYKLSTHFTTDMEVVKNEFLTLIKELQEM